MQTEQQIQYMANLAYTVFADGEAVKLEDYLFNTMAKQVGAKRPHMQAAVQKARASDFSPSFPFSFADSVRNLEDMLVLVLADKSLAGTEKQLIVQARKQIDLTETQFKRVVEDAKTRLKQAAT